MVIAAPFGITLFRDTVSLYRRSDVIYDGLATGSELFLQLDNVLLPSRGVYLGIQHTGLDGITFTVDDDVQGVSEEFELTDAKSVFRGSQVFTVISDSVNFSEIPPDGSTITIKAASKSGDPITIKSLLGSVRGTFNPLSRSLIRAYEGLGSMIAGHVNMLPSADFTPQPGDLLTISGHSGYYEIQDMDPITDLWSGVRTHDRCSVAHWKGD